MRRAVAIAFGLLLLIVVAAAAGLLAHRALGPVPAVAPPPPPPPQAATPRFPDFLHGGAAVKTPPPPPPPPQVLEEVRDALATTYYRFVPGYVLEQPTIDLVLEELDDPYTEYLDPTEYEELHDQLSRSYFGVGLTVGPGEGGLIVTSSRHGPAREAGIRPGDVIIEIDGQPAAKLPFDQSAALITGEAGTTVRLTVRRRGHKRPLEFTVVRHEIEAPVVRARLLEAGGHRLGYIRILSFREDVAVRVAAATRRLVGRGAEGLILDLRGDPGGLLSQAVQVTSIYLQSGLVLSTSGLHRRRSYFVSGGAIETARPLAVLVDGATASAAEIVAAALADHGRAALVGVRTYGKATVQTVVRLSNGGALKLTTATYLTPAGTSIRAKGIRPEVRATDDLLTRADEAVAVARGVLLEQL